MLLPTVTFVSFANRQAPIHALLEVVLCQTLAESRHSKFSHTPNMQIQATKAQPICPLAGPAPLHFDFCDQKADNKHGFYWCPLLPEGL